MPAEVMHMRAEYRVDEMGKRHLPGLETDERQCREQRHDTLRVIEDAGGFEDQDETERNQRVKHACHQAVERNLECEQQLLVQDPFLLGPT